MVERCTTCCGNSALNRLTTSTRLPRSSSTSHDPGGLARHRRRRARRRARRSAGSRRARPRPWTTCSWPAPGSSSTSGLTIENRFATAPRRWRGATPSAPISATELGRRLDAEPDVDAALRIWRSRSVVTHANVSRPGVRRMRLTWPPSSASRSSSVTSWPRLRERVRRLHARRPAADDEPTRGLARPASSVPTPKRASRPAAGFTVQLIASPLNTRPMQPWLPRMQW